MSERVDDRDVPLDEPSPNRTSETPFQPQTMDESGPDGWHALGEKLFGAELADHRFRCPHCNHVMSIKKARALPPDLQQKLKGWRLEQECIGRYLDTSELAAHFDGKGCNWAAYGLFSGPFFVKRESGVKTPVFGYDLEPTP